MVTYEQLVDLGEFVGELNAKAGTPPLYPLCPGQLAEVVDELLPRLTWHQLNSQWRPNMYKRDVISVALKHRMNVGVWGLPGHTTLGAPEYRRIKKSSSDVADWIGYNLGTRSLNGVHASPDQQLVLANHMRSRGWLCNAARDFPDLETEQRIELLEIASKDWQVKSRAQQALEVYRV